MRRALVALGVAVAALSVPLLGAGAGMPASSSCGWSLVTSVGAQRDALTGVAAASASSVWAVGTHWLYPNYNPSFTTTLIEHWDGTRWSAVSSPNATKANGLASVAAIGRDAWAVGRSNKGALTLHWKGTRWSQVANPGGPGSSLSGVAMVSPHDVWVVGSDRRGPLVLRWNGSRWSKVADPGLGPGGTLGMVARIPGTSQVWVDGLDMNGNGAAARWTGSGWEKYSVGSGGGSLAAASTSSAWIVGTKGNSTGKIKQVRTYHWDGSTWTEVPAPNPSATDNGLFGVTARTSSDAWTVGVYKSGGTSRSLVLQWKGSTWSHVPAPGTGLSAVTTVPGTREAWAVGFTGAIDRYHC